MPDIKITDIELQLLNRPRQDGHLGFAVFKLNDSFGVADIGIYKDGSGIRLNFPEKMLRNGRKLQLFYPLNAESREVITKAVFEEIEKQRKG